jgi:hypothetical protein
MGNNSYNTSSLKGCKLVPTRSYGPVYFEEGSATAIRIIESNVAQARGYINLRKSIHSDLLLKIHSVEDLGSPNLLCGQVHWLKLVVEYVDRDLQTEIRRRRYSWHRKICWAKLDSQRIPSRGKASSVCSPQLQHYLQNSRNGNCHSQRSLPPKCS